MEPACKKIAFSADDREYQNEKIIPIASYCSINYQPIVDCFFTTIPTNEHKSPKKSKLIKPSPLRMQNK